jgi:transcriptional regulator with XRE-family HTH domain
MTQAAFASVLGKTQGTVQKYEKGEILPEDETLKKIADYGGITVEWLLTG